MIDPLITSTWFVVLLKPSIAAVSRYQLVVMKLPRSADDSGPVLPLQDTNLYEEGSVVTYQEAMESQSLRPYVAVEINMSAFNEDTALFVVGHQGNPLAMTNLTYKNGPLSPSSYYAVFLRAFWPNNQV
jgi:hypothetical protein